MNPVRNVRFRWAPAACLLSVVIAAASAGVIRWQDRRLDMYESMLVRVEVSDDVTGLGVQPSIRWSPGPGTCRLGVMRARHHDWGRVWGTSFTLLVRGREGGHILSAIGADGYRKVEIAVPYSREIQSVAVKLGRVHEE